MDGLRNCGEGEKGVEVARQVASRSRAVGVVLGTISYLWFGFCTRVGGQKGASQFRVLNTLNLFLARLPELT